MGFSIVSSLANIDSRWSEPKTYLLLVPGLSLLIHRIDLVNTLLLTTPTLDNLSEANQNSERFANCCKWHLRGSLTQIAIASLAMVVFKTPSCGILGLVGIFEVANTVFQGVKNPLTII
jgi:hypothetical protein